MKVIASDEFVVCSDSYTTLVSNCGRGAALNQSWRALHKRGRLLHGPNSCINKGSPRHSNVGQPRCVDTSRMGPETAAPHAINAGPRRARTRVLREETINGDHAPQPRTRPIELLPPVGSAPPRTG